MLSLVFGMGNGVSYSGTKHNIGSEFVKQLIGELAISSRRSNDIMLASVKNVVLSYSLVPNINLSYIQISRLVRDGNFRKIYVVFDDVDIQGKVKIRSGYLNSTHNGIRGITSNIKDLDKFVFVRVGVGRRLEMDLCDDVLSRFHFAEQSICYEQFVSLLKQNENFMD